MYTIYALVDPRDKATKYIGITKDVYARMRQHSRCEGHNEQKNAWIKELQKEQLMFIMESLGKVKTFEQAIKEEAKWLRAYLDSDLPLLNIAVPQSNDPYAKPQKVPSRKKQKFCVPDLPGVAFSFEGS